MVAEQMAVSLLLLLSNLLQLLMMMTIAGTSSSLVLLLLVLWLIQVGVLHYDEHFAPAAAIGALIALLLLYRLPICAAAAADGLGAAVATGRTSP